MVPNAKQIKNTEKSEAEEEKQWHLFLQLLLVARENSKEETSADQKEHKDLSHIFKKIYIL